MSQVVSVLYICDSCRTIRQLDVSKNKLVQEGELFKIKDVHSNHEAVLYFNSRNMLERITNDPPPPPSDDPIIKGLIEQKKRKKREIT